MYSEIWYKRIIPKVLKSGFQYYSNVILRTIFKYILKRPFSLAIIGYRIEKFKSRVF